MGIFDDMRRKELAQQQQQQQRALYKEMAQQVRQAAMQQNAGMGLLGGNSIFANQTVAQQAVPVPAPTDLDNDPVYGPSLSMLCDLWKAAWGEGWTSLGSEGADDNKYWGRVLVRLERAQLVERHPQAHAFRLRS